MVEEEVSATDATSRPEILAAAQELLARVKAAGGEIRRLIVAVSSGITEAAMSGKLPAEMPRAVNIVKNVRDD